MSGTRRLALFDLDGTLTDSGAGICNSIAHALTELGMPPLTSGELRSFIGPPLHESFARLGLSADAVDRAVSAYREYFADRGIFENVLYDGIEAALAVLVDDGCEVAVASSKPTVFVERILEHFALERFFAVAVGSELDGTRSAKVEVIRAVLELLPLGSAGRAVMVGDRSHDVVGAAALGLPCVGAGWGYGEVGELSAAGATVLATTPHDLPLIVHGLLGDPPGSHASLTKSTRDRGCGLANAPSHPR